MSYDNIPRVNGALFQNHQKNGPTHPDLRGELEIDDAFVQSLLNSLQQAQPGQTVVIDVAAWWKEGPVAGQYLSMSAKMYTKNPKGAQQMPGPVPGQQQPQQGYQPQYQAHQPVQQPMQSQQQAPQQPQGGFPGQPYPDPSVPQYPQQGQAQATQHPAPAVPGQNQHPVVDDLDQDIPF
jgi:hypothetical protein